VEKSTGRGTTNFQVGDWQVDPNADRIHREGEEVRLEPRVMDVLTILAGRPGEVISREQLEAEVWAGQVVGYDALASSIIKLRKALGDDSRHPRYIETVSKKGYRLIARVTSTEPEAAVHSNAPSGTHRQQKIFLYGALALLALLAGSWLYGVYSGDNPDSTAGTGLSVKRTLMVLPFTSIDGDPREDYFVDGITDDIITDLSGLSGIVVISSTATYRYKGQQIDPKKVGEEMGADFLLEGSVRKSGERWRINAKLINAYNNTNLWAGRFENTGTNLFAAQDEITRGIVDALAVQLNTQDRKRLDHKSTTNFEAYDLFLHGQKLFKERTREANKAAQDAYRKAIELDPNFARAYGALAVSLDVHYWRGWTDTPSETLDRALNMAMLATELDPSSPQAYWALGYAHMYLKQSDKAAKAVEKAVELAPNYADGYGLLALINNQRGNGEKAAELITNAMKLNPYYSWDYPYILGRAFYTMGKYDEAIKPLLDALNRNVNAVNPRIFLTASYIALGREDDAKWEVEQLRVMSPETTLSHLERNYPIADKTLFNKFLQQLHEAGLPE